MGDHNGRSRTPRLRPPWRPTPGAIIFVFNTDHKVIGIQYMVLSFVFFIFGGILAELIRAELALPGTQFVGGSSYNQLFTIHGTIMIFLWIIPAFAGAGELRDPAADSAPTTWRSRG